MEHGVVSLDLGGDDAGRSQEAGYLADGQGFREPAAGAWKVNGSQGVVAEGRACQQKSKKTFKGRDSSGITAMGKLLPAAMFEEEVHGVALNFFQCQDVLLPKESEKNINISLIGLNSIVCQALLGDQVAKIK
jgi:hypothetical protein